MSHKNHNGTPKTRRDVVQTPSSLQQCIKCDIFLSPKDRMKHTERVCSSLSKSLLASGDRKGPDDSDDFLSSGKHGFIKDNSLYASAVDINLKERELDDIPENFHDCLLLVHLDYLEESLDIKQGDSVQLCDIEESSKINCYIAWPHASVKNPCSVCVYGSPVENYPGLIKVTKIKDPVQARTLKMKFEKGSARPDLVELTKYMKQYLRNRCVYAGLTLDFDFEGDSIKLVCKQITTNEVDDCLVSLSGLSVNGNSPKTPSPAFHLVRPQTRIIIPNQSDIRFKDIGGLQAQIKNLRDMIELPIKYKQQVSKIGYSPEKAVLLYGVRGCGKSLTMRAFMNELSDSIFFATLECSTIVGKKNGDERLKSLFNLAYEQQPSVIFVDKVDILCGSKKSKTDQQENITFSLLTLLDELSESDANVVVIGITNKPESIDADFRTSGRFDCEIEFPVPMAQQRIEIFNILLSKSHCVASPESINLLAETAYSFTGADLKLICQKASKIALDDKRDALTEEDLRIGMRHVKPSAMREITLEVPRVLWTDIGGMRDVKETLESMVVWPLTHPEVFTRMGVTPPKGILMYGPPGCSKTMVGKALATESRINFIAIKGPELFSKWVGESERAVRELFRKAKQASPSILFFDEIDALATERGSNSGSSGVGDRVLTQILTEMDGVEALDGVIIVAATNRPDIIDEALLRPGRLDSIIYVPLPDSETRKEIFQIRTKQMPVAFENASEVLASRTEGYSGAEITAVCQQAGVLAIRQSECPASASSISLENFEKALTIVRPRTSAEKITFYENYAKRNKMVQ